MTGKKLATIKELREELNMVCKEYSVMKMKHNDEVFDLKARIAHLENYIGFLKEDIPNLFKQYTEAME